MFCKMRALRCLMYLVIVVVAGCGTIGVFEKNVSIPGHEWQSTFKPEVSFDVTDTASLYNIFVVLRHTDAYRYNNIWMNVYLQIPGDTLRKERLELRLATDDKGWLGTGMDDIFEHRIRITQEPQQLRKAGSYHFRLEHIMREDPLRHVLSAGIRVEKAQ